MGDNPFNENNEQAQCVIQVLELVAAGSSRLTVKDWQRYTFDAMCQPCVLSRIADIYGASHPDAFQHVWETITLVTEDLTFAADAKKLDAAFNNSSRDEWFVDAALLWPEIEKPNGPGASSPVADSEKQSPPRDASPTVETLFGSTLNEIKANWSLKTADGTIPASTVHEFMAKIEALSSKGRLSLFSRPDTGLETVSMNRAVDAKIFIKGALDSRFLLNYTGTVTRSPSPGCLPLCSLWGIDFFLDGSLHKNSYTDMFVPAWVIAQTPGTKALRTRAKISKTDNDESNDAAVVEKAHPKQQKPFELVMKEKAMSYEFTYQKVGQRKDNWPILILSGSFFYIFFCFRKAGFQKTMQFL